jgi:hypothetical protein
MFNCMKIKIISALIVLFFSTTIKAQKPFDLLNKWAENSPIQKIYLQLDRDNYIAGETAQFKAYLIADFIPDTSNSSMYVALYDGAKLINKSVFPVLFSSATGSIDFPDSLATGYYTIRSFSKGMLSQKEEYFFQRKIFINGIEKKQISTVKNDTLRVEFFPEGGNLVNDLTSTVAFKITDKNELPVDDIVGKLYNSKNEELVYFSCLHDGMGLFDFKPLAGEKYYVKLKTNLPDKKYFLPEVQSKGIVLSIIHESNASLFEIKQKISDTAFVAAYMIGQMQHHVIFKKEFSKKEDFVNGSINTKNLPSGIMQITVFNKDDLPLSERLIFVNNNEYLLAADVRTDSLNFSEGGRNKFFITMKDTVQGQISISITDPTFDVTNERENNIISGLLLSSDINGYISNPSWYLSSNEDSVKNALDLLMMVNGWRRFKWTEIANQKNITKQNYAFISLKGEVMIEGYKKPFANKQMMLMINSMTAKNKRSNHIIETDKYGAFKIDSLILFGKNKLFFTDIRGRKSSAIDVKIDADTLFAGISLLIKNELSFKNEKGSYLPLLKLEYDKLQKSNGLLLKEVIVTAKKKTPLEIIETKYASGLFGGFANKSIDLINSDEAHNYITIFEYLQTNVGGLRVVNNGLDYKLYYRQPGSLETTSMIIYLDEIETDASIIANIPPEQIGFVKVYSTFLGGTGNSQGGAIAIYSKKTEDYTNPNQLSYLKIYNGYTIMKEFYAPNYKLNKIGLNNDNRITIDWRPQIFINNINPKIPISFYNNNRTKKFKVVVEGMTNSGKIIWLEKTIGE